MSDSSTPPTLGYATNVGEIPSLFWRAANLLIAAKGATLPPCCVKCGSTEDLTPVQRKLFWHEPGLYLLIALSIWIYLITALLVHKSAVIHYYRCARHNRQRMLVILGTWFGIFLGVSFLFTWAASDSIGFAIAGGTVMLLSIVLGILFTHEIKILRIDNHYLYIHNLPPDLLNKVPYSPIPGHPPPL